MIDPESLMRQAIAKAREGIDQGQSPFGCAISLGGQTIAIAHNSVFQSTDITAHAEINALRSACEHEQSILLEGAIVASSCEPCPMCMSALHWARVSTVYFGASISDAEKAGFNELKIPAAELLKTGGSAVTLVPDTLRDENLDLLEQWRTSPHRKTY